MPTYSDVNGNKVKASDMKRLLWYSACCTYWTDDWNKLSVALIGNIPCCPKCGSVGLQTTAKDWFQGVKDFDNKTTHYRTFIDGIKETCQRNLTGHPMSLRTAWAAYYKRHVLDKT